MRYFILMAGLLLYLHSASAQTGTVRPMSQDYLDDLRQDENVTMPVHQAFEYNDNGGYWDVLLLENAKAPQRSIPQSSRLNALIYLQDHGGFLLKQEIKDIKEADEADIHFWDSYCSFTDLDGDGRVDPVLVYASYTGNENDGYEVSRVKIFILRNNIKYAVRARESITDAGRQLTYSSDYNTLPAAIRSYIEKLMERIRSEKDVLLKNG